LSKPLDRHDRKTCFGSESFGFVPGGGGVGVGVLDALRVLADDPDHGGLRVGLVQRVEVLAQRPDDRLILWRGEEGEERCLVVGAPGQRRRAETLEGAS